MRQTWRFLTQKAGVPKGRIATMSLLTGAANALMLALLNQAAAHAGDGERDGGLMAAYLVAFVPAGHRGGFLYLQFLAALFAG